MCGFYFKLVKMPFNWITKLGGRKGGGEGKKVLGSGIIGVSSQEPQQSRSRSAVLVPRTNTVSSRAVCEL